MTFEFYKYHGTGNDFILIDNRLNDFPVSNEVIRNLCDRNTGIGADGLILLSYKDGYDFEMNYFNSDGNSATMCGNGGRCAVAFANKLRIINNKTIFSAIDGAHRAEILKDNDCGMIVKLDMQDVKKTETLDEAFIIDTGSPHYINFVKNVSEIDVIAEGRKIRNNERFVPGGINVDFVEENNNTLFVRTYERGVENETLSCGTGVVASAIAYAYKENKTGHFNVSIRR